jgi:endoglucanase
MVPVTNVAFYRVNPAPPPNNPEIVVNFNTQFIAKSDGIYADNQKVNLKGLNWFGFETTTFVAHGLWSVKMETLVAFIKRNGFNAVRLPFSADAALNLDSKVVSAVGADPQFEGITTGEALDLVVNAFTRSGILVMFDLHRLNASQSGDLNWFKDWEYPQYLVTRAWTNIVKRYVNNPGVFAVDLKNEVHGSTTWSQWIDGVNKLSAAIHGVNPKLLVFVGGVEDQTYTQRRWYPFWGEVIAGATDIQPAAKFLSKIVYSPHVYGPSVAKQDYFYAANYPANMPEIWNDHWAKVVGQRPVVIGEWGGQYDNDASGKDLAWNDAFVSFLVSKNLGCSTFYWALNPNSGDTGGLLKDDWTTPESAKLALLNRACPNPSQFRISV